MIRQNAMNAVERWFEDDGFEWTEPWLDVWVHDMREPDLRLSAPRKAAGFIGGGQGGYRNVAEEWQEQADRRACDVINATLEDMDPAEVCAIHHVKLHAVYHFRVPVLVLYCSARQKIGIRLRAKDFS